jgi:hypothetical protein
MKTCDEPVLAHAMSRDVSGERLRRVFETGK